MITQKIFWQNEELVFFNKGSNIWTFYRKSNVPKNVSWKIIEDPEDYMLQQIAVKSGINVIRQYNVTPPDKLEWWMGTYTYLPNGTYIHCDPVMYGSDDPYNPDNDISEAASGFVINNREQLFNDKKDTQLRYNVTVD